MLLVKLFYLCSINFYYTFTSIMKIFVPAKINLGLNIVSKRPDGYHNLETVFYPVPIYDELETLPADQGNNASTLQIEGIPVMGNADDNLVMKAYNLIRKDFDVEPLAFRLKKNIPTQAGMGGGSADASFTLLLLNKLFHLNLSEEQLLDYALKLGADCPFFIKSAGVGMTGKKACFGTGVGEILEPHELDLKGKYLVVVKPSVSISTKEAFSLVKPTIPAKCCKEIARQKISTWKAELVNDFEVSAFALFPQLAEIKKVLYREGAEYAAMSGSGSAMFGIFDNKADVETIFATQADSPTVIGCWL